MVLSYKKIELYNSRGLFTIKIQLKTSDSNKHTWVFLPQL